MSQKSSVPQAASFVSVVLKRDTAVILFCGLNRRWWRRPGGRVGELAFVRITALVNSGSRLGLISAGMRN